MFNEIETVIFVYEYSRVLKAYILLLELERGLEEINVGRPHAIANIQ